MSRWGLARKAYLLIAVVIMLLFAWPSSFIYTKLPPPPVIKVAPAPEPELETNPNAPQEFYYDIYVNDIASETAVLTIKDPAGNLWLPVSTLTKLNLIMPAMEPTEYYGEKYLKLSDFSGITYKVDLETLSLKLYIPVNAFAHNVVDLGASIKITPDLPPWGGFMNYNLFAVNTSSTNNLTGTFDLGIFSPIGVGTSTFSWQTADSPRPWVRLLTTWRVDYPETMQTLRLGDAVSKASNWSGALNYGGIQWARNFETQPAFITFPLPGFRGTAFAPSILDIYVNSNLAGQQAIKPGSFEVINTPVVTGAGKVKFITKDILGREQVVQADYYSDAALLKKGLTRYSLDLGIIRRDLGVFSNNYRNLIAALTYDIGLNDHTTVGFHGEALSYQQAAGITFNYLLWQMAQLTSSVALSHSEELGTGGLAKFALYRQTTYLNLGASTAYTTANFTQQGQAEGRRAPELQNQFFGSVIFGNSALSFNYTKIVNRNDQPSLSFITVTGTTSLFNAISVNATLQNSLSGPTNKTFFLNMSYAINDDTFINGSYNDANDQRTKRLQLLKQLPPGPGYGYDITANRDATDSDNVSLSLRNNIGTYVARGLRNKNLTDDTNTYTYSLDVSGGAVYMDHHFELSREILNSFSFVKVPGYKGVDVYWQNQKQGTTNENGYLMIPNILAFQKTKVKIDPSTLPLNTEIKNYEVEIAPYINSGVLTLFDVKKIYSIIATLKQPNGEDVAEGSLVKIDGQDEEFIVGFDGQLYVTINQKQVTGQATGQSGTCRFSFTAPEPSKDNPYPDIGNLTCQPLAANTPIVGEGLIESQVTTPDENNTQSQITNDQGKPNNAINPQN